MKVVVAHLINEPFQDTFIARKKWNRKKKKRKKKKTKNEQHPGFTRGHPPYY